MYDLETALNQCLARPRKKVVGRLKAVSYYCRDGVAGFACPCNKEQGRLDDRDWKRRDRITSNVQFPQFGECRQEERGDTYAIASAAGTCLRWRIIHVRLLLDRSIVLTPWNGGLNSFMSRATPSRSAVVVRPRFEKSRLFLR